VTSIKVAFANICQGLIYEGKKDKKDVFSKYWPSAYLEVYSAIDPDIPCLAEVPLDDASGNSKLVHDFSDAMNAADYRTDVHEKSWFVESKFYGTAIISKFEFKEYTTFKLPNPRFEMQQPDGAHWILHDKTVQGVTIQVDDTQMRLFNLHYFPFHRFNHNLSEPELEPIRTSFVDQLHLQDKVPTILTGDFNNAHADLALAYPELFQDDRLADAIDFRSEQFQEYCSNSSFQLDHILYDPRDFDARNGQVVKDYSDHNGLAAEFTFRRLFARHSRFPDVKTHLSTL
jgi:endonuclease/exonuclease/phosphatase family metal-dependent hydrolase